MDKKMDEKEKLILDIKTIRERIDAVLGENAIQMVKKDKNITDSDDIDKMLKRK